MRAEFGCSETFTKNTVICQNTTHFYESRGTSLVKATGYCLDESRGGAFVFSLASDRHELVSLCYCGVVTWRRFCLAAGSKLLSLGSIFSSTCALINVHRVILMHREIRGMEF